MNFVYFPMKYFFFPFLIIKYFLFNNISSVIIVFSSVIFSPLTVILLLFKNSLASLLLVAILLFTNISIIFSSNFNSKDGTPLKPFSISMFVYSFILPVN